MKKEAPRPFWTVPGDELLGQLGSSRAGLTPAEARERLSQHGPNTLRPSERTSGLWLLLNQFRSPLVLVLIGAAIISFFLGDRTNAIIILVIVVISGVLGFGQEYRAAGAVTRLLARVRVKTTVRRGGRDREIPVEDVVPGDIVVVNAGDVIPADCVLLESKNLFADEAALTGESYPVDKFAGTVPPDTVLARRTNVLHMGTNVVSGTALALVVATGRNTEFGKISDRLRLRPPETEFARGVRRFGAFLMQVTLFLVIAIFAINVFLKLRPERLLPGYPVEPGTATPRQVVLEAFMFAVALAVGLTPQLLPAIISINLSKGAQQMARRGVVVKRLAAIENFGSMTVLCSDKTGTLTQGTVQVQSALDPEGQPSEVVFRYAGVNAALQTGFTNPIDAAIVRHNRLDLSAWVKLDEVPYDFIRKRLSVLVQHEGKNLLVTKGAVPNVLAACTRVRRSDGTETGLDELRDEIDRRYQELSGQGFRLIGVAVRDLGPIRNADYEHESALTFLGFVVLSDPLKPTIAGTVQTLRDRGIRLKLITGDNRLVAQNIGIQVGLENPEIITGRELYHITDSALPVLVDDVDIFAEVEPGEKERIVNALKKAGNVVGFLGDGINDAPALRAADVGISVESGVDVAKEAADIVLLRKDLAVLAQGITEGRRTFANTLKYVFMATSANFGNMFSMAGASLFLPFLPLLPSQILLTNLLTDFPEMTIATDRVDPELVDRPRRWDISFIRRFMLTFGLLSSVFDYLTFAVLHLLLHAGINEFRTGWFVESVISASMIVLVIRTRRPFFRSLPGKFLFIATLGVIAATVALPYTPLGRLLGFIPLPGSFLGMLAAILLLYIGGAEVLKRLFYRSVRF